MSRLIDDLCASRPAGDAALRTQQQAGRMAVCLARRTHDLLVNPELPVLLIDNVGWQALSPECHQCEQNEAAEFSYSLRARSALTPGRTAALIFYNWQRAGRTSRTPALARDLVFHVPSRVRAVVSAFQNLEPSFSRVMQQDFDLLSNASSPAPRRGCEFPGLRADVGTWKRSAPACGARASGAST
jgi:hypothetical protein